MFKRVDEVIFRKWTGKSLLRKMPHVFRVDLLVLVYNQPYEKRSSEWTFRADG